ncbi:solute carrier family 35 member D3 isoform X1 [Mustela erminea]|uniref:solute carrier family 35 member D3 isoform X1 n=2 Tax=Mustela erminea TaxID=36723 RepID=UPI00138761C8|nr:solute carrier family 35 member D3 isoform X1 [Mustela erminea]
MGAGVRERCEWGPASCSCPGFQVHSVRPDWETARDATHRSSSHTYKSLSLGFPPLLSDQPPRPATFRSPPPSSLPPGSCGAVGRGAAEPRGRLAGGALCSEPAPLALRRGVGRSPPPPSLCRSRLSSPLSSRRSRSSATTGCGAAGAMRHLCRGRVLGISVAIAHGVFSGSLNILLKFLISRYQFSFLTLVQCLTSSTAALSLELLRRLGLIAVPPFGLSLARSFAGVAVLSTLQSSLTLWSLRGLSLPMYVVFKRCLPLVTMLIGVLVLKNGAPSPGVLAAVLITTCGAALAGAGDLTGDPIGYVTGVLAVLVHAAYLVLIQKASADTEHGPLTAQYVIAVSATPLLVVCSFASTDSIHAWTFPGWKDPAMVCIFVACILIGCAMNFTTLHCTYINSAVTTSFVGVVKSIATITVGMVAFSDVEPTSLFIAGVVVNTLGSIIYCVAKFLETRKQSNYEDLETQRAGEEAQPSGDQLPFVMEELPAEDGNGGSEGGKAAGGSTQKSGQEARGSPRGGPLVARSSHNTAAAPEEVSKRSLKDAYLQVWRLVRGTKYMKKDYLIENEELPSP